MLLLVLRNFHRGLCKPGFLQIGLGMWKWACAQFLTVVGGGCWRPWFAVSGMDFLRAGMRLWWYRLVIVSWRRHSHSPLSITITAFSLQFRNNNTATQTTIIIGLLEQRERERACCLRGSRKQHDHQIPWKHPAFLGAVLVPAPLRGRFHLAVRKQGDDVNRKLKIPIFSQEAGRVSGQLSECCRRAGMPANCNIICLNCSFLKHHNNVYGHGDVGSAPTVLPNFPCHEWRFWWDRILTCLPEMTGAKPSWWLTSLWSLSKCLDHLIQQLPRHCLSHFGPLSKRIRSDK